MVVHHCVRQTDHPNLTGVLSALAGYDTPAGSLATSSRPRPTTAIAIGARNSLRFGTAELGHQANVSLCIDGRCCRSMPRAAIQYASPVSRRLARRYVTSRRCGPGRCDTRVAAQTLLVYSLLGGRCWSVLRSTISKIGPPSGDDVARNPAHLELLIRLLLACRTRPERTTHG